MHTTNIHRCIQPVTANIHMSTTCGFRSGKPPAGGPSVRLGRSAVEPASPRHHQPPPPTAAELAAAGASASVGPAVERAGTSPSGVVVRGPLLWVWGRWVKMVDVRLGAWSILGAQDAANGG